VGLRPGRVNARESSHVSYMTLDALVLIHPPTDLLPDSEVSYNLYCYSYTKYAYSVTLSSLDLSAHFSYQSCPLDTHIDSGSA
jgi:hypothetical protein